MIYFDPTVKQGLLGDSRLLRPDGLIVGHAESLTGLDALHDDRTAVYRQA